ncbi:hypothetical protein [Methanospirillum sp.]
MGRSVRAGKQERRGQEVLCSGCEGTWYGWISSDVHRSLTGDFGREKNVAG